MSQRSRRTAAVSQRQPDEDEEDSESETEEQDAGRRNPRRRRDTRNVIRNSNARPSQAPASQRTSTQRPSTSRATQNAHDATTDEPYEFSQATQRADLNKLPPEVESHLIGSVLRYLMIADRAKTMIQRANIIKAALPNHSKHYRQIMAKVKTALMEVFGYNLVEMEGNKYILTNNLENSGLHLQFSDNDKAEHVLLFIVLAHIFMSDESGCTEEDLFNVFKSLEIINEDNFKHDYFGDVRNLLTEKFVKQGYLDLVTISKPDPLIQHYQWGVRAENELEPRHVLEFMSKIFDNRPLNTWPAQYKTMQLREGLDGSP